MLRAMCHHVLTNPDTAIRNTFDTALGFPLAQRFDHV